LSLAAVRPPTITAATDQHGHLFGSTPQSKHLNPQFLSSDMGRIMDFCKSCEEVSMFRFFSELSSSDEGQDIAEYAVMLAVILVLVVGTIRIIGTNANNVFSSVASSVQ
jgi:Flp pilus assembly pilin Flp